MNEYGYGIIDAFDAVRYALSTPSISITSPTSSASGIVTISATASDQFFDIERVEFYVDNVLLATDTTASYSCLWDTSYYPSGSTHQIKVVAYNELGHSTSTIRNIWVTGSGIY